MLLQGAFEAVVSAFGADSGGVHPLSRASGALCFEDDAPAVRGMLAEPPRSYAAAAKGTEALQLLRQGNSKEAKATLLEVLRREENRGAASGPRVRELWKNLGLCCAQENDNTGALEWYRKAYCSDPNDAQALWGLARVERRLNRWSNAQHFAEKLLRLEPGHAKARELLEEASRAVCADEAKDGFGDFAPMSRLGTRFPSRNSCEGSFVLPSTASFASGYYPSASVGGGGASQTQTLPRCLSHAVAGGGGAAASRAPFALGAPRSDSFAQGPCAAAAAIGGSSAFPRSVSMAMGAGACVASETDQRMLEARELATREEYVGALQLLPTAGDTASLVLLRALCLARLARYEEASRGVLDFLHDRSRGRTALEEARALALLAHCGERERRYPQAFADCDRALQLVPNLLDALIVQGQAYEQSGHADKATRTFEQCLALDSRRPAPRVHLGHCHLARGDLVNARLLLEQAIEDCGAPSLDTPASLRGAARAYLALVRHEEGATAEAAALLRQAGSEHRNLGHVLQQAPTLLASAEGFRDLVQRLRGLCDLDLSCSEATPLARIIQLGIVDATASGGGPSGAKSGATWHGALGFGPTVGWSAPCASSVESGFGFLQSLLGAGTRGQTAPPTYNPVPAASSQGSAGMISASPAAVAAAAAAATAQGLQAPTPQNPAAAGAPVFELHPHEFVRPEELHFGPSLGSGGFGCVFQGTFRGRQVAVKRIHPGLAAEAHRLEELWREIDSLRFLRHPRLVRFLGACLTPPTICVLTEFMPGGSLHDLLHVRRAQLQWALRHRLGTQIAEAVAFLHNHTPPVVHRDIKSMNILLDQQLEAKLCDFGLTMPMQPDKTHFERRAGGESGSPRYMAPEFFADNAKITEKIDVWAEGCVLVEVFGGPVPFHDCESIHQICTRLCVHRRGPAIPEGLPLVLHTLLRRCLEFDAPRRCNANEVFVSLSQSMPSA